MSSSAIKAIVCPKWGLEMSEGTIAEWRVQEGDALGVGDEVVDIETSKIVNTVESPCTGVLRKQMVESGAVVPVGALLGVCADANASDADINAFIAAFTAELAEADLPAAGAAKSGSAKAASKPAPAAPAAAPKAASAIAELQPVTGPLSEGPDDSECHASPAAKKFAKKLNVNLNNVTGTGRNGRISKEDIEAAVKASSASAPAAGGSTADDSDVKASPVARRLAKELGVNLNDVTPTGARGRISKEDVQKAAGQSAAAPAAAPAPASAPAAPAPAASGEEFEEVKLSMMRKTIASRLTESKQNVPHFYLSVDCEIDDLLAIRKKLNETSDTKISVNDFIIKASGQALVAMPEVNVQYGGDVMRQYNSADVSVAVATDGGLLTPVVRAVETKGLAQIAAEMKDLATRAQEGKLQISEFSGGTFSISNLGMFGVKQFDAVINPPQAAILAVSAGEQRPVVKNGELAVATVMTVTMSCDHRAIDGSVGAKWLQVFKGYIESPATMLL